VTQLFIDIETRRTGNQKLVERLMGSVKPPGSMSKPETIAKWWTENGPAARLEAVNKTALDGTHGRLASFGWAVNDEPVKCVYGDDEPGMLHAIAEVLNTRGFDLIVAFNGEFDFRFLYQRFVINGIRRPFLPGLSKGDYYYDPMKEWAGYRGYIKQSELAEAMGIAVEDETTGADIGTMIDAGDWAAVERHNISDVETLREIYRRMNA
jgi:DNA polymerase elongation subunit (family B)